MGSTKIKKFEPYGDNGDYEWFIIQYDEGPHRCTRKVVRTIDLIWNMEFQLLKLKQGDAREHVLLFDQDQLHLCYILYKSKTEEDCMENHRRVQEFQMKMLNRMKPYSSEKNEDQLYMNHNFWVMVMYSRCPVKSDQAVLSVVHRRDAILVTDSQTRSLIALVKEGNVTYKGFVMKVTTDLAELVYMLWFIKRDTLRHMMIRIQKRNEFLETQARVCALESKAAIIARHKIAKKKQEVVLRMKYAIHLLQKKQR